MARAIATSIAFPFVSSTKKYPNQGFGWVPEEDKRVNCSPGRLTGQLGSHTTTQRPTRRRASSNLRIVTRRSPRSGSRRITY